jgi:hypothetical protein
MGVFIQPEAVIKSKAFPYLSIWDFLMDDEYYTKRVRQIRDLAEKADPFIRRRLLDLAERYENKIGKPSRAATALGWPKNADPERGIDGV